MIGRTGITWAAATLVVVVLAGAVTSTQTSPAATKEEFTAFGVNMNGGRAGVVDFVIEKWSPDGDREALLKVFADQGQDEMLKELVKRPRLGYIRLPNTLGHDIHYAMQQPLPEGGRRVIVVTDRPIGFAEARNNSRTMDYPFTMVEFRFNTAGVGEGRMSTGTQIVKSKDGTHLELETWQNTPVRFTEVKAKTVKK
jgi:formylmethanofuran:tetrahydromethanopterin formyltransferase